MDARKCLEAGVAGERCKPVCSVDRALAFHVFLPVVTELPVLTKPSAATGPAYCNRSCLL